MNSKSPLLAGISLTIRDGIPDRRTAWLTWEDSNLRMVELESTADMSRIGFAAYR